jgi:hypothetical protein
MKKYEQQFTTKFLAWARHNLLRPAVFEIKSTRGKGTFYLSELKQHQRDALAAAKHGAFTYKIPDAGFTNPFDAIFFTEMQAYLVIEYPSCFVLIDVDDVPENGNMPEEIAKKRATLFGQLSSVKG